MRKILAVLGMMLSFFVNGQAPIIEWQKSYGGINDDYAYDYIKTLDGGYILAGSSSSTNGDVTGLHTSPYSYADVWIVKLDANKNIVWQKCYGGTRHEKASGLVQLPDSSYIVLALTGSTDGDLTGIKVTNDIQNWLFRISKTGTIIWSQLLSGYQNYGMVQYNDKYYFIEGGNYSSGVNRIDSAGIFFTGVNYFGSGLGYTQATKLLRTRDNGFAVAGISTVSSLSGGANGHGGADMFIARFDSNFVLKWQNLIGTTYNDGAYDLIETSDNGFLLGGYTTLATGATLTGHHGSDDYYVVKVNKNGQPQWQKYVGGSMLERLYGIVADKDGYVLYGVSESRDGDVVGFQGSLSNNDAFLAKIDTVVGNLIWSKAYGSSVNDAVYKIVKDTDSTYLFCGYAGYTNGNVIAKYGGDFWLGRFKLDNSLPLKLLSFTAQQQTPNSVALNWQTAYEVNVSHIIIQRSNNGKDFTSIGKLNASCCSYEFKDGQLSMVNSQLYYRLEMVDKDGSKTYSQIQQINIQHQTSNIVIFPNPAKDLVTIECLGAKELLIIDNLGRTVYRSTVNSQPLTVNTKQMSKGIYIVKAVMNNGVIKTEKLVVE